MGGGERYAHRVVAGVYVLRGLFQRNGIWHFRARRIGESDVFCRSCQTRSRRAAESFAIAYLEDLARRNARSVDHSVFFTEAFEDWLDTKAVRDSTRAVYESDFRGVYEKAFGERPVAKIDGYEIQAFLKALAEDGGARFRTTRERRHDESGKRARLRPASVRNRRKHLGQLRSFFRWCRDVRRIISEDPTAQLRVERGEIVRKAVALEREEVHTLLLAAREARTTTVETLRGGDAKGKQRKRVSWTQTAPPHPFLWAALAIAFHTGLRTSNVLALEWERVDLLARRIVVGDRQMKAHRDHAIPIHRELAEVLAPLYEARDSSPAPHRVLGVEVKSLKGPLATVVRASGIRRITWYDTRHTFATLYLASGARFEVVERLLAHKSQGSTTWHYVHVPWRDLVAAVDRFPPYLDDGERRAWIAGQGGGGAERTDGETARG